MLRWKDDAPGMLLMWHLNVRGGVHYDANITHWGGDEDIMTADETREDFRSVC